MRRLLAGLLVLLSPGVAVAQVPPSADWRVIETEHFRITYGPGLDSLAVHTARRAEAAHATLSARLASPPQGTIDILLTDFVDVSNGRATPYPSNRIVIYTRPPVDRASLAYFGDWIDLVVTHELAHIFHLDRHGALGSALRAIFGRVPMPWPVFPAVGTPRWSVEGLATYVESDVTGAGRVHGTYHDMVVRTAILAGAFPSIDRLTGEGPRWPGASQGYIYGSLFADYLSHRYGPEVHAELVTRTAQAWIPPFLAFDRIAKKTTGRGYSEAYADWRTTLEASTRKLADSLRAEGLTEAERLTFEGYETAHPRIARDGKIAYAADDGRSPPAIRIIDPATGKIHDRARRNGPDVAAWLPDGSLLTAQLELNGPYRVYGDLYQIEPDGGERRLTYGARLTGPDVTHDGRRVVAVQGIGGTNRLVIYDLETGALTPLTAVGQDIHWAFPRWSPTGDRVAVARWQRGEYDIVVLDTLGTVLHEVTRDRAIDASPAWSPDGRYLIFSSDRSGIANLYAYDFAEGDPARRIRQVTNVLTGAFQPDVSPDGRWIVYAAYDVDGFHIERIPFDPATWREPAPVRSEFRVAERASPAADDGAAEFRVRPYSPWPTLRPTSWLPELYSEGGTFVGGVVAGKDLVGRLGYAVSVAYNVDKEIFDLAANIAYAGLGNPVLELDLWHEWEKLPYQVRDVPGASVMSREDGIAFSATLNRRRWRSSASLTVGAERVVERRRLFDAPGYSLVGYEGTTLDGIFVSAGYANAQRHPFSISPESGASISLSARRRLDREPFVAEDFGTVDRSYDEAAAVAAAYPAFRVFGYAHHVLALRGAGRVRTGPGAGPFEIGGLSAGGVSALGGRIGGERRFLPVRGFDEGTRFGTRAWTASLEYRFPVALIDRGHKLWPLYLDRLSGALFLDAGHAWCNDAERRDFVACPAASATPLVGTGAELALDLKLFFSADARLRLAVAHPVRGGRPGQGPTIYVGLGPSF